MVWYAPVHEPDGPIRLPADLYVSYTCGGTTITTPKGAHRHESAFKGPDLLKAPTPTARRRRNIKKAATSKAACGRTPGVRPKDRGRTRDEQRIHSRSQTGRGLVDRVDRRSTRRQLPGSDSLSLVVFVGVLIVLVPLSAVHRRGFKYGFSDHRVV